MPDKEVNPPKRIEIGQAVEQDTAQPIANVRSRAGGPNFEWKSYLDLLDKARRDLARLKSAEPDSDSVFNLLTTAHHIYDWVINDPQATGALKDDAGSLVYGEPPGPVGIIYLLCTRAKHMVSKHSTPPPTRVARYGWGDGPWGEFPWGGGPVYEVEVGGAMRNVLDVAEEALVEWEQLLQRYGQPIQHPPGASDSE